MNKNLPRHWVRTRIGAFCSIRTGMAFSQNDVVDASTIDSIACFRTSNIQQELDTSDVTYVPNYLVNDRDYFVRIGDILMSTANSNTLVGKCCMIRSLDEESLYGGFISRVRIESELLDCDFAYQWLTSDAVQTHLRQRARQTTNIANLPPNDVLSTPIVVPPLSEQRRIVEVLNEARDIRRLRQQAEDLTAKLTAAIFYDLFAGDDGFTHWPERSISTIVESAHYGSSTAANEDGNGIPMLRMNNVTYEGGLDLTDLKHVELSEKELAKHRLETNDVLFNRTNSLELVGKTGLWDGRIDAVAASYFVRVRLKTDEVDPRYFVAFLNLATSKRRFQNMAKPAIGMANINAAELQRIRIPLPPIERQNEFGERVAEIHSYKTMLGSSEAVESLLTQSLLVYGFDGELTADWREANREQLEEEAAERDEWLREAGVKLIAADTKIAAKTKDADDRHAELNREQLELLSQIKLLELDDSAGTFTLSTLTDSLVEPLDKLPVASIRRHLDVLAARGLVKSLSRRAGAGGSVNVAFGNAFRLPIDGKQAAEADSKPDAAKRTELDRLSLQGRVFHESVTSTLNVSGTADVSVDKNEGDD